MSESPDKSTRCIALRLTLQCDLAEVRPATLALRGFLAEHGVAADDLVACELALTEACNNAVNHAAGVNRESPIRVEAICGSEEIEIRVTDRTPGFEWPERIDLPEPDCERGRGLYLIESLMDAKSYLRGRQENCLVMRKTRTHDSDRFPAADPVNLAELTRRLVENERIITGLADELYSCYESFSAIFRYSSEQKRAVGLEDFSRLLLNDLLQITTADWFVLRLLSTDGAELRAFAASEPLTDLTPLPVSSEDASLEGSAAIKGRDVWFDQNTPLASSDPLLSGKGSATGFVHPIIFGETLIGTLAVGKAGVHEPLTAARINVVHTFADFLAIQIVNSRVQEERVNALLTARDLEIARGIQRSLLLKTLPQLPGFEVAGHCESARQVGGDFYDVIRLSENALLLVIADVMGKGIPAAMFAAIMRSLVRALPDLARRPSELLERVNLLLFDELSEVDMFITAQLAYVDSAERRVVVASAGHCPVLLAPYVGAAVETVAPEGMPLGILADAEFGEEVLALADGSRLLLYTDGLTEARDPHGELYGQERLIEWMRRASGERKSVDQLKEELVGELMRFQANMALNDDQTFLILAR